MAGQLNHKPKLTDPIRFLGELLRTWHLSQTDAVPLLGMEESDRTYVDDLLHGVAKLRGRDVKFRIACLFRVREALAVRFRDQKMENEWLREPHAALLGHSPMDCLLEGSMENLFRVKKYVETFVREQDVTARLNEVYRDLPAHQSSDVMAAGLETLRNSTRDDSW